MAYVACVDANVLHPWILCDLVLRLSERGLFRLAWSSEILNETSRSIREHRPQLTDEQLRHRFDTMTGAFPEAMVEDAAS